MLSGETDWTSVQEVEKIFTKIFEFGGGLIPGPVVYQALIQSGQDTTAPYFATRPGRKFFTAGKFFWKCFAGFKIFFCKISRTFFFEMRCWFQKYF
jgi:hypothetical protein